MSRATLVVLAVLAVTALAGCSKAPPSGELSGGASGVALMSGDIATNEYTPAEYPAGQVPVIGQDPRACPPPGVPNVPQCVPASSSFDIHVMVLPAPDASGYKAFLVGAAGELELGMVEPDDAGMWRGNATVEGRDVSGNYTSIEIRMGSFVYATASSAAGAQPFVLAPGLDAIIAEGSYEGKTLNVTVSGLPVNGTYVGRLYSCDPESKLLTVAETFPVANGGNEFAAPLNIADYAEFHVHVGTSLINLYKTTIGEPQGCGPGAPAAAASSMA
ncbi:MAG: hypothetical protein ACYC2H_13060 [Thermoplasmatota archaeon]